MLAASVPTPEPKTNSVKNKTSDNWVVRDERLIRLTGAYPFNSEPPLSVLFHEGFLTPPNLHFVRNHGQVPRIDQCDDWTISIEGMVDKPQVLTLQHLQQNYDAISLPVTLTCAGNRRKEQNLSRKTKGFNWGSAGTSTSFWTGALLCDVLRDAHPHSGARYVVFEGAEDLPNGKYATGVHLSWALDFDRGIILAWKQNGQQLMPDHGWPLRAIVPGVIGGRSVKWLRRIIVQATPPNGWYHKYDNRVIPTTISPEASAESEIWWQDERYAIYNLNLQSVIVFPEHNSTLNKSEEQTYTLQGFAYNGGGIQVSRVEISLDAGKSWIQAHIRYPEQELRDMNARGEVNELYGGKVDLAERYLSFCWCFWHLEVPIRDLMRTKDIVVRAMDVNMVAQPRDMYWSVLGMLGNWWFRVAVMDEGDYIKFVHPTNLSASDGWMDMMKAQGQEPSRWYANMLQEPPTGASAKTSNVKMVQDDQLSVCITKAELAKHENWFVVNGQVYDGTDYLSDHPGGPDSISLASGEDATDDFMAIHSDNAKALLAKFHVGQLDSAPVPRVIEPESTKDETGSTFLNPKKWKFARLVGRSELSRDTRQLDFALQFPEQTSGLLVGAHVFVRLQDAENNYVMRAYTPISCHRTKGILSLLVKVYFPDQQMPGGKMSMLLDELQVGDRVEIKGPVGSFNYLGNGQCLHRGELLTAEKFYMISGGSGITPCYQIMKEISSNASDSTMCHLLYGNREHTDIMCSSDLQLFKESAPDRIVVDYWISRPTADRPTPNVGRITPSVLDAVVTSVTENHMVLVCGPDGMVEAVRSWAKRRNLPKNRLVIF